MSDFKDKQLEFLIELVSDLNFTLREILLGEIIVEELDEDRLLGISDKREIKDRLSEKLKEEFRKRVVSSKYKIEELIYRGKDIYESITGGYGELGSKLFLSFLMTKEEKQGLAENTISYYIKNASDYKREDFETTPSDEELFQLIS